MAAHAVKVDPAARRGVQRPVIGCGVDAPRALVGHVGELGAVLDAEQLREAEHEVAVGAGVGDDDVGALPAVLAEDHVDHVQRLAGSTRDDFGGQPGALVVDHVQPCHAAFGAEVLAVGARVDTRHGDDEAHPVDPGDQAAAPLPGERDTGLRSDQPHVRRRVGLCAEVVLVDVTEPVTLQRRHALLDDR